MCKNIYLIIPLIFILHSIFYSKSLQMKLMISIIIVNYNTERLLEDCLSSIFEKTQAVDFEIIVIDNNSEEGSLDKLISKYKSVKFHFAGLNLGFGKANNLGATLATGKYLFFLNPDTLLINNAVNILFHYMESHPETGICGGNMYKGDMTPASSLYNTDFLTYEYKIIFNIKRTPGFNYSKVPQNVLVIVGADLFIRKDVFDEVNGFDPDFFMYFEEVDLCYRTRKAGHAVTSVPDAQIIHLQGGSAENKSEDLGKWSYNEHWYSKYLFFYKTKGLLQTKMINYIYRLKLNLAMMYFKFSGNSHKIEYWRAKELVIQTAYNRLLNYIHKNI